MSGQPYGYQTPQAGQPAYPGAPGQPPVAPGGFPPGIPYAAPPGSVIVIQQQAPAKSGLAKAAGILMIIGAIFAILFGMGALAGAGTIAGVKPTDQAQLDVYNRLLSSLTICGVMFMIATVFSILGAIFAFKHEKWNMAFLGAVLGTVLPILAPFISVATLIGQAGVSLGWGSVIVGMLLGGAVFNLIAIFLLLGAKKDFK